MGDLRPKYIAERDEPSYWEGYHDAEQDALRFIVAILMETGPIEVKEVALVSANPDMFRMEQCPLHMATKVSLKEHKEDAHNAINRL